MPTNNLTRFVSAAIIAALVAVILLLGVAVGTAGVAVVTAARDARARY
jgi:hypothetical protein